MRLKNKKAIVTGGASGMGQATSIHFAREGAKVSILDMNIDGAQHTVEKIKEIRGEAYAFKIDLRNLQEINEAVRSDG